MTKAQSDFIELIGSAAVSLYEKYKILPSLTIAQAILESNWGKSGLSKDCYNYFGMKWNSKCGTDYKEYSTKEQNKDGSYVTIRAKFRKYPSVERGIQGYYDFLQYPRYTNLRGVTDYNKACDLIRQDGWATSLSYATNLKRYIATYNLTEWDKKAIQGIVVSIPVTDVMKYQKGTYVVTASSLRVRTGAGTGYEQKKFSQMTATAQKKCAVKKPTGLAFYVNGVKFTAKEVIKVKENEYWAKTPSGYVCLEFNGSVYARKTS